MLMNDYERQVNMNDCEIREQPMNENKEQYVNESKEQFINERDEWFMSECVEWSENKEQSMSDKWFVNEQYVNDKHLWIICAFL